MHLPLDVNCFCPLEQGESVRVCAIRPEWREVDVKAGPRACNDCYSVTNAICMAVTSGRRLDLQLKIKFQR
jgi:hypothetical protein